MSSTSSTHLTGRWATYDAIEIATVGRDTNQPVATGHDDVERLDGIDHPEDEYEFVAHSVYGHTKARGVECLCDCVERDVAQMLGTSLAEKLGVPVYDYTIAMAGEVIR